MSDKQMTRKQALADWKRTVNCGYKPDPHAIPMRNFAFLVLGLLPGESFEWQGRQWTCFRQDGLRGARCGSLQVLEQPKVGWFAKFLSHRNTWLNLWDRQRIVGKIVNGRATLDSKADWGFGPYPHRLAPNAGEWLGKRR